jgi:hypothetical protein
MACVRANRGNQATEMNDNGHPLANWRETRETFIVYAVLLSFVLAVILVGFGAWGGSLACR